MVFIFAPELIVDLSKIADIVVLVLGVAALILIPLLVPKLAAFLKKKGWDDEVFDFIDIVDDYFDVVEAAAEKTGWKGDEKLVQLMKKLAAELKRELTPAEKKAVEKRAQRNAIRLKGSVQLDGPGMV